MDLPALQTITFYLGNVHVGTGIGSPVQTMCWPTAIMVAYGQHGEPMLRQTSGRTPGQRDNFKYNVPDYFYYYYYYY